MNRLIRGLTLSILFFLLSLHSVSAEERIVYFNSDITVDKNNLMTIEETITVRAEGNEIKRGIYRDIPTVYKDHIGRRKVTDLHLSKVSRDGRPEAYHTEDTEMGIRIYIGQKDVLLKPDVYTYRILYVVDREVRHFPGHDEIYWNVTGNVWAFPIDKASARVYLPEGAEDKITFTDAFTGHLGSKGKDCVMSMGAAKEPIFETTKTLNPGEGLTITVGWQKGFVAVPTREQELRFFIRDNRGLITAAIGLVIVVLYYLIVWSRVGRDPEKGTIYPIYEPPPRYSPASIRYIANMAYDDKVFAAAILSLAVKGAIKIKEEPIGKFILTRLKTDGTVFSEEEKSLLRVLFKEGNIVALERTNRSIIKSAAEELKKRLSSAYERIYFYTNKGYFFLGLAISVCVAAISTFYGGNTPVMMFLSVWLSFWSIGVTVLIASVYHAWKGFLRARTNRITGGFSAIFMSIFAIPFIGAEVFAVSLLAKTSSVLYIALLVALGTVNYIFYNLLKAPTLMGRKLLDQIEGFKLFLGTTERHRLNMQHPANMTVETFQRYLPFAVVLEVENQWTEKFTGIVGSALMEDATRSHASWYSGDIRSDSSLADIASSIGNALSSSVSTTSGSSGSGGSSGGGGGGGGGGGW